MNRFLPLWVLSAGALSACSFDFGGLSNGAGAGGASATSASQTVTSGAMVTTAATSPTTNVTGVTASAGPGGDGGAGTTAVSASATDASSSTGSATNIPFAHCGGFTDDFAMFPNLAWTAHGMPTDPGMMAQLQVMAQENYAFAFHLTNNLNECALTIDLGAVPNPGKVYLDIHTPTDDVAVTYDDAGSHMVSAPNGQNMNLGGKPSQLGIAITGGQLYYLYRTSNTWTTLGTPDPRPSWMDNGESVNFGISGSTTGNKASFDNVNLTDVRPSDLLP